MPISLLKYLNSKTVRTAVFAAAIALTTPTTSFSNENPTTNDPDQNLIQLKSSDSIEKSVAFLEAALLAWNPSLAKYDVKGILNSRIQKRGVLEGLINPTLTLIDVSYATGNPRFGSLLNPMLNEISPSIAQGLNKKHGLPLDYKGDAFSEVTKRNSKEALVNNFRARLDGEFYSETAHQKTNPRAPIRKGFLDEAILGSESFLKFKAERLQAVEGGPRSNNFGTKSEKDGSVLTPQTRKPIPRGLFSNRDIAAYNTCPAECADQAFKFGTMGAQAGSATVGSISTVIGAIGGGPVGGAVAGGTGAIVGGLVGGAAGVGIGLNECRTSKACGGKGEPDSVPKNDSTPDNPPPKPEPGPQPANTPPKVAPSATPKPQPAPTPKEKNSDDEPNLKFGKPVPVQDNNIKIDRDHNVATPKNPTMDEPKSEATPKQRPPTSDPKKFKDDTYHGAGYNPNKVEPVRVKKENKSTIGYRPPASDPMHISGNQKDLGKSSAAKEVKGL